MTNGIVNSICRKIRNLEVIAQDGYEPTERDILEARSSTTGTSETLFDIDDGALHLINIGSEHSEPGKWIYVCDNVDIVVFPVNLVGYERCLTEDRNSNRLLEALRLWKAISNSDW